MASFSYIVAREPGQRLRGRLKASSRQEAMARLKQMGYFLLEVQEDRPVSIWTGAISREALQRVSRQDIAVFTRQLASLIRAGLPLSVALRALADQTENPKLRAIIEQLIRDVEESAPLSEALAKHPRAFSKVYIAVVRAGEEGGLLAEVLARLAGHLKEAQQIRSRIQAALAYPIFICVVGILTVVVLLTFVIPRFTILFVTMGEYLPWPTRLLIAFSNFMDRWWWTVPLAVAAVVLGGVATRRQERARWFVDRWILAIPLVGRMVLKAQLGAFARTLGQMLSSGVVMLTAIEVTRGVVSNRVLGEEVSAFREEVLRGRSVAESLRRQKHFSSLVVGMAAVGEESGQLPEMLVEVADIYDQDCQRAIEALTGVLGPALIVVLGGIVGFLVTAILLPVFQASAIAQ